MSGIAENALNRKQKAPGYAEDGGACVDLLDVVGSERLN